MLSCGVTCAQNIRWMAASTAPMMTPQQVHGYRVLEEKTGVSEGQTASSGNTPARTGYIGGTAL